MKFSVALLSFVLAATSTLASFTLDPSVIQKIDGRAQAEGESDSLVSDKNFIDFCKGQTITNGLQVLEGSCNPTPMGIMPSKQNLVASKIQFPVNFQDIPANQEFTVKIRINNMQLGVFTNPKATYYAAPQFLNGEGKIIGHTHIVMELIESFSSTKVLDPTKFTFFKGINAAAENGVVSQVVTNGLPAGVYRLATINAAANHQPVLMPVAQHGSTDDVVYFTVGGSSGKGSSKAPKGVSSRACRRKRDLRYLSSEEQEA